MKSGDSGLPDKEGLCSAAAALWSPASTRLTALAMKNLLILPGPRLRRRAAADPGARGAVALRPDGALRLARHPL